MTEIDVGQGAVLGFDCTENTVGWGRNADNRNEVSKQDDPKDEKFKGVPSIHVSSHSKGAEYYDSTEPELLRPRLMS